MRVYAIFLFLFPFCLFGQCPLEWYDDKMAWADDHCTWIDDKTSTCTTDIRKPKIVLFPNPTTDFFEVVGTVGDAEIINSLGQVVRYVNVPNAVSVLDMANGLYFLRGSDWVVAFVKM